MLIGLLAAPGAYCLEPSPPLREPLESHSPLIGKIDNVYLYSVENGAVRRFRYTRDDLANLSSLKVNGYVWGIVAFCDPGVTASAHGETLTRIAANQDGAYSIKYFGAIPFHELFDDLPEHVSSKERPALERNGYSLFPIVNGAALVSDDEFLLSFQDERERLDIPVLQKSYRPYRTLHSGEGVRELNLNYLGCNPQDLRVCSEDLLESVGAIENGVRRVESLFGMNLIDTVNIVEFNRAYGAVTVDDNARTIWLYSRVFEYESPLEMTHIASHEALHQYVMARGWTSYSPVRELFSDIKGYDLFSRDRFLLITRGVASPEKSDGSDYNIFFDFIDERNFLDGARGGHSHLDLDEFCASFFHSLMYVNRLKENLSRKIYLRKAKKGQGIVLTRAEKKRILNLYARTIQCFLDAPSYYWRRNESLTADPTVQTLREGLRIVRALQAELSAEPNKMAGGLDRPSS